MKLKSKKARRRRIILRVGMFLGIALVVVLVWVIVGRKNNSEIPKSDEVEEEVAEKEVVEEVEEPDTFLVTNAPSANCTIKYGALMLVNPNFTVEEDFIAARKNELVSI